MSLSRVTYSLVLLSALVGCASATNMEPRATVAFQLDAPLCSSVIPVKFAIDDVIVGADTFRVHLANEHTRSSAFTTTTGPHKLGGGIPGSPNGWFDTTVTLRAGQAFTDTLHFYCS